MNVNESAKMKQMLQTIGYDITEDIKDSDLVLLNTCTVRERSTSKVYSKLSNLKHLKEKRKGKR